MATTPAQIDQQRRVIEATRNDVAALLDTLGRLQMRAASYNRIGLSDDAVLDAAAFEGTGTDKASYRAAITSIAAIDTLLGQGHGSNFEKFSR